MKHGYSLAPCPYNNPNVMTSFPTKVDAMVIHGRYACGTDIVVEVSLIRRGVVDPQFGKVLFSTAPVISWLAKSKGKPVVSCLSHAMTHDFHSGSMSQPNPTSQYNNNNQFIETSQGYPVNLFSQQAFQYSQQAQYHQFSQNP